MLESLGPVPEAGPSLGKRHFNSGQHPESSVREEWGGGVCLTLMYVLKSEIIFMNVTQHTTDET